jgi:phosphopentomutase/2,3-bisphosphoglycerate-independent phosphoglycerate mutase family metalloenzyme
VHVLRRLAAFLVLAPPLSLLVNAGATWGAAPMSSVLPREPHGFEASPDMSGRVADERTESAVVLVVLDGVRWQDVFGGADRALTRPQRGANPFAWASPRALMPNLQQLLETQGMAIGAPGHGAEMVTGGAQRISLPSYREIFTGKADPACQSNDCPQPPGRTVADDVYDESGPRDVAVVSSWPNIARAASAEASRLVLTTGRRLVGRGDVLRADDVIASLLDAGMYASAFPGQGDYRPDALTARIALRYLATARPRFLFVGLGDCDEYGHRNDYRGYLGALHDADAFLGELGVTLEAMGARGRHTTVIVTTDHGRAYDFRDHGMWHPESGRVWLVASGADVHGRGLIASPRRHTLSDVAPTVRALLGIVGTDGAGGEPIAEL